MSVTCREVNLLDQSDASKVIELLNVYATDEMGGGDELPQHVKDNLISSLVEQGKAHVFFGLIDSAPAALAICFDGFSTFECKPVLNIHDFCVHPGSV